MFANPELTLEKDLHQPSVFNGVLKAYQLKVGIYLNCTSEVFAVD